MSGVSLGGGGGGSVMRSLRVIELQVVAFIMVFSVTGVVPLFDLVFPVFTTAYLLILSRLAFPNRNHISSEKEKEKEKEKGSRAYLLLGTTLGLFLPLAYVLGGFARGDQQSLQSATPHLFLLSCQILTENILLITTTTTSSRLHFSFSPPVIALVTMLYTVRRIFVILDWVQHMWLPPSHQLLLIKDVAWFWFGRSLALANLAYFSINLFGFLIPTFLPKAFYQYFIMMDHNQTHSPPPHKKSA